jgi:hypothetical protein
MMVHILVVPTSIAARSFFMAVLSSFILFRWNFLHQ